jgi:Ser/Thr protein kinase RdoA (MazF antagonist)
MAVNITDAMVAIAVAAYKAPRLHVNDTAIDREIDMRAALEAYEAVRPLDCDFDCDKCRED